jgi:hypothetical protein
MKNVYFLSRGRRLASCKTFVRKFSSKKRQKRFEMAAAKTVRTVERKKTAKHRGKLRNKCMRRDLEQKGIFLAPNSRDVITEGVA